MLETVFSTAEVASAIFYFYKGWGKAILMHTSAHQSYDTVIQTELGDFIMSQVQKNLI